MTKLPFSSGELKSNLYTILPQTKGIGVGEILSVLSSTGLHRPVRVQIHGRQFTMDPSPQIQQQEDEWDTDGFVIPSLGIGDSDQSKPHVPIVESSNSAAKAKKEENIYLGPHGAPPSLAKQQELNSSNRKQRLKQKLKEADKRNGGMGRENKVDNLRELVGGGKVSVNLVKGSPKDWLDPHCQESQFERR
ncbi:hypothetical protein VNO80_05284 [Phaseolus coccineus]|uniref:Uncharacterized protein n=1 Tax=Phaseolus coccineus TaxID=3886 RepID=A0AAN9NJI8_PHACN